MQMSHNISRDENGKIFSLSRRLVTKGKNVHVILIYLPFPSSIGNSNNSFNAVAIYLNHCRLSSHTIINHSLRTMIKRLMLWLCLRLLLSNMIERYFDFRKYNLKLRWDTFLLLTGLRNISKYRLKFTSEWFMWN